MPRNPGDDPDLLPLLWEVGHALTAMSRRMERTLGVSGPQRLVLREVAREPDVQPGELAARLAIHPSTVTGLVDRLVERGLVVREQSPDDRRSSHLRATRLGQRLLVAKGATIESVVNEATAGITSDERVVAAALLRDIAAALRRASEADSP